MTITVVVFGLLAYLRYRAGIDRWGEAIHYTDDLTIYRSTGATNAETKALAEFLLASGIGSPDVPAAVRLEHHDDGYRVYFVWRASNAEPLDEEDLATMRRLRNSMSKKVFAGEPVALLLCSSEVKRNSFGALAEPRVLQVVN